LLRPRSGSRTCESSKRREPKRAAGGNNRERGQEKNAMMKSKVRYLLIMLIFVVSAVVYIDRSNISIAGTYLAADYHITKPQLGWVFSAFLLGYAAFQIPAGWVVGKLGPRKTLTYGLIWWSVLSVATALVPPTMTNALWVLIAVRFVLGLGESVAYPSSNQFIAAWFPTQERGKANGWVFGGVGLGSGTAPPLVAFIIYNLLVLVRGTRAVQMLLGIVFVGIVVYSALGLIGGRAPEFLRHDAKVIRIVQEFHRQGKISQAAIKKKFFLLFALLG